MDVLADILPPSYLVKSETTAKDRQPDQQEKQSSQEEGKDNTEQKQEKKTPKKAYFVERRSGKDRRLQQKNRGRWLDSRLSEDRRKANVKSAIKLSI